MKYRISKFYIGVYILAFIFILVINALTIYGIIDYSNTHEDLYFVVFCGLLAVIGDVAYLYQVLFDFQFGSFSVDETRITLYIGFKKYCHRWEEFNDCDVVGVSVDSVAGKNVANAYWVYFATRPLTQKEKIDFLRKTRRDLDRIAFFQYNAKALNAVMPYISDEFRARLAEREAQIQKQMNLSERIYHR